jgi:hypothetical protein
MRIVSIAIALASSLQSGSWSVLWAGWRRMIRLCVSADSAPVPAIVANCASCHDWGPSGMGILLRKVMLC